MGGFMLVLFVIRFFVFHLYESPKFLMGRGRDAEAVEVVHKVAQYNGTTSSLTLDMLRGVEKNHPVLVVNDDSEKSQLPAMDTSGLGTVRRKLNDFRWGHVASLFETRKLAWSTSLLVALWGAHSSYLCDLVLANVCPIVSPHRPRFPTVRHLSDFILRTNLHQPFTSYNSFITYLYGDTFLACSAFLIGIVSLATRGADFGDGSTYITYRNVSTSMTLVAFPY
jgi:hypothetical protein